MSKYVFTDTSDPTKFSGECNVCKARLELTLPVSIRVLTAAINAFCKEHEHPAFVEADK